ncbi:hypothetical protein P2318_23750 [Myxococcaceae bacterium GXIMD 01537]
MESWNQQMSDAVRSHTPAPLNRRIDDKVEACVRSMAQRDRAEMSRYLEKLDREWDLNRAVSVGAAGAAMAALLVAGREGHTLRGIAAVAAGLLLQHGLMGWGPLAELVRALGVRTRREIDLEKFAIKALRGDFERVPKEGGPLARANAALVAAQS